MAANRNTLVSGIKKFGIYLKQYVGSGNCPSFLSC